MTPCLITCQIQVGGFGLLTADMEYFQPPPPSLVWTSDVGGPWRLAHVTNGLHTCCAREATLSSRAHPPSVSLSLSLSLSLCVCVCVCVCVSSWGDITSNFASLVVGPRRSFSLATNNHWFSMPAGRLSLVTVGRRDQRQMCKIAISPQLLSARSRNARKRCLESFTVCAPRPPIAIAATHPICLLCQCKRRVSAGLIKNTAHTIAFVITVSRSWNWTLIRSMVRTHLFTIMLLHHHQSLGPHSWLAERFCSITRSRNPSSYYPSCLYFLGCI